MPTLILNNDGSLAADMDCSLLCCETSLPACCNFGVDGVPVPTELLATPGPGAFFGQNFILTGGAGVLAGTFSWSYRIGAYTVAAPCWMGAGYVVGLDVTAQCNYGVWSISYQLGDELNFQVYEQGGIYGSYAVECAPPRISCNLDWASGVPLPTIPCANSGFSVDITLP